MEAKSLTGIPPPKNEVEDDFDDSATEDEKLYDEDKKGLDDSDIEEDSEEDDDDETEPVLKYQRLPASVPEIAQKDSISCFAAHEKFLVVGTEGGFIHLLDLNGNESIKLSPHAQRINCLSLEQSGDYVASCSDDGRVVVTNLFSRQAKTVKFNEKMSCVSLSPMYASKPGFVAGNLKGELFINTKGFFGDSSRIIHSGEGAIGSVSWHGNYIAWSNANGVKAINAITKSPIAYISPPRDVIDLSKCRCNLVWFEDRKLLVGWGDCVQICQVETVGKKEIMKITSAFRTDYTICGLAPFSLQPPQPQDLIGLLAYPRPPPSPSSLSDTKTTVKSQSKASSLSSPKDTKRPELRVVSSRNSEISSDSLPVKGYEKCGVLDYSLATTTGPGNEALYYIVSPKDIVVARPRDWDDHVTWLINHEMYEEALEAAEGKQNSLRAHNIFDIRENYLNHLVDIGEFEKAASFCPRLLKNNLELWESWIYFFAEKMRLRTIAPFIPVKTPRLSTKIYNLVLNHLVQIDPPCLLKYLHVWPVGIYDLSATITAVIDRLNQKVTQQSPDLMRALGELYMFDKQFEKAIQVYLQLKSDEVFMYVRSLDLFGFVKGYVLQMMTLDQPKTLELFMENLHRFTVREVVDQLEENPRLLHAFLNELFLKDPALGAEFHNRQVELYVQFDQKKLLYFLQNSNFYHQETALKLCKDAKLHHEEVYILTRMGSTQSALMVIINKLKDVKQAIEFVETQQDEDLWEILVQRSLESRMFLSDLLEHVGDHYVDSLSLVQKIPESKEIPQLKQKIQNIFTDKILQISVEEGCMDIQRKDCTQVHRKFVVKIASGVSVDNHTTCGFCNCFIIGGRTDKEGVRVYTTGRVACEPCADAHDAEIEEKAASALASSKELKAAPTRQRIGTVIHRPIA
ncbi:hypothetical protein AAMO2058_001600500 [Amorphochlora amoebiformis]